MVLLFRPECSPVKVDQGFTSGCHSGEYRKVWGNCRWQPLMARLRHGCARGYYSAEGSAFGDQSDDLAPRDGSSNHDVARAAWGFAGGHGMGGHRSIIFHKCA